MGEKRTPRRRNTYPTRRACTSPRRCFRGCRKRPGMDLTKPAGEKPLDEMSDLDIIRVAIDLFGTEDFVRLMGWCALFAVVGVDDLKAAREALLRRGLSRSAMYRALLNIRRLQCRLRGVPLDVVTTQEAGELIRTLARPEVPAGGTVVV